jgi:sarcosine oxidase
MYDALVVGLGAMGSAALYELASRGVSVVGVDAYDPPHSLGSTHGRSRIIREAYYEHPSYVPLVQRAYAGWARLERVSGTALFRQTGGLNIGAPDCGLVAGALESASRHGLDVELLDSEEIERRFPAFAVSKSMIGVYERTAGMLFPEACIRAYLTLAKASGAEVRTNCRVLTLARDGAAITATTGEGTITAHRVVICAGAWSRALLASLGINLPLEVARQTMHWLEPRGDASLREPQRFPIALIEHDVDRMLYTMPDTGDGVKIAIHHEGAVVAANDVDREVRLSDTEPVEALAARFIPSVAGRIRESAVCLYTNTPDHDFIIDVADGMPNVVVVSACSGHGFKFASAIGEVAAQLALGESCDVDLSHFRAGRFGSLS